MFGVPTFDWFDKDCVGIKVVEDENAIRASTGMEGELSGKISEYIGSDLMGSVNIGGLKVFISAQTKPRGDNVIL